MPTDVIAEYELVGRRATGPEFAVHVRICKPVQSVRMAPAWSCSVTVEPLSSKPFEIYGEGSFQALCLGAKHAVQMLATFMEQEGTLHHPEGDPFDVTVFGFQPLPPESGSDEA
jgi:hypothetical protein